MIKALIILFNTVIVFLLSFLFGDSPITVTGNFPKNVKPATEFTAEIVINKGTITGFAKLQLEVPNGFTVNEVDSKSGNFSFTNNIAKIIWTATPTESEITVKFSFIADETAVGSKIITSKFSYVNNNNKEVVEMAPSEIIVGDENTVANVSDSQNTTTAQNQSITTPVEASNTTHDLTATNNLTDQNDAIVCSRIITKGIVANEYNVDVKIKKGSIKGFAKYQDVLPIGFIAKAGKTNGSSFSLSDGKLKFVWVSLPTDAELLISYVLQKSSSASAYAKLENGEFSFLENDQSKKIKMAVDVIDNTINGSNNTLQISENTSASSEPVAATTNVVTTTEPVKTDIVTETNSNPVKETTSKREGNVQYSVQIGAFINAIQPDVLSKKFNLTETVRSEMAEGFSKFIIGNFNEYKLARTHREDIKQKGCNSAFVVAYNRAKRITVQEALMITSQKWFK